MKPHRKTALTAFTTLLLATSANAAMTLTFTQSGSKVLATYAGSLNPSGFLDELGTAMESPAAMGPNFFNSWNDGTGPDADIYVSVNTFLPTAEGQLTVSPNFTGFGPADGVAANVAASSDSFAFMYAESAADDMRVLYFVMPAGYTPGSPLAGEATFDGTLASLGLTPGTYEFAWGLDSDADTFTMQVGEVSAVPEPGSIVSLAGILAAGLFLRQRRISPA